MGSGQEIAARRCGRLSSIQKTAVGTAAAIERDRRHHSNGVGFVEAALRERHTGLESCRGPCAALSPRPSMAGEPLS